MQVKPIIYAFIDSQNLNLGVISQGWNLSWPKFRRYLSTKYQVSKAFLFIGYIKQNEFLYSKLKDAGFILVFKPTVSSHKYKIKGNVDAELVLHAMIEYDNFDSAIVVSGDGDFSCLISFLAENNKLFKILVPNERYSSLLRKFNQKHYIVKISQLKESLQK